MSLSTQVLAGVHVQLTFIAYKMPEVIQTCEEKNVCTFDIQSQQKIIKEESNSINVNKNGKVLLLKTNKII